MLLEYIREFLFRIHAAFYVNWNLLRKVPIGAYLGNAENGL